MIRPAISEMRPIRTKSSAKATPKQPKAAALPVVADGAKPTLHERALASAQNHKWCSGHRQFLPFDSFHFSAITSGTQCMQCASARAAQKWREKRERRQAAVKSVAGRANSPSSLRALVRAMPLEQLIAEVLESTDNPREVEVEIMEATLACKQEQHGKVEGARLWRECKETGLEMIWITGRQYRNTST